MLKTEHLLQPSYLIFPDSWIIPTHEAPKFIVRINKKHTIN
jgi:hypothetical protein